jgi:type I restriction enzyme S subunit
MLQNFHLHATKNSVKATVDSLRLPTFKDFELPLPPLPEQTAIAAILTDMDTEITTLETRLAKTKALKTGMCQELLTGKTRLL